MGPHISPGGGRRAAHSIPLRSGAYLPRGGANHLSGRGLDHKLAPPDSALPQRLQGRARRRRAPPAQRAPPLPARDPGELHARWPRAPLAAAERAGRARSPLAAQPGLRPLRATAPPRSHAFPATVPPLGSEPPAPPGSATRATPLHDLLDSGGAAGLSAHAPCCGSSTQVPEAPCRTR